MNVRVLSSFLALSFAVPLFLAEKPAAAQVSDADRNAARDLYNEGWQLQQAGRYADAVDRYQRSLAVFPAPTTAFRLAQCKAAIGKLVEAAEEFRAIVNAPLPQGAPPAFATAKQDAAVELGKLEPRIPKVKIDVQPAGVQGLAVMIDGVSMPTALVGVARPVNPGTHTVTATAPGYAQAQAQIDVRERQSPIPEVTLTLQPSAVTYAPNGGTTYPSGGTTYPSGGTTYQGQPYGGYQGTSGYSAYNTWVPPRRRAEGPRSSFLLGIDGALSVPFGSAGADLTNAYGVGGAVGVDVGLRLVRVMYLGLEGQASFYGDQSVGTGGFSFSLNAVMGFMSNPDGFGFYGEFGGGLRTISFNTSAVSTVVTGDVVLGLGAQVKAGSFRFIPKVDFFFGPNPSDVGGAHGFFTLGIIGFWELPFATRPPPSAAPVNATPATTTTPAE